MREMELWDIAMYWAESKYLADQFTHFKVEFTCSYHKGHYGWTFG